MRTHPSTPSPRGSSPAGQAAPTGAAFPGQPGPDVPVFVISVAAELTGLHPQTLRTYDRLGLVRPGRTGGGGRRYSWYRSRIPGCRDPAAGWGIDYAISPRAWTSGAASG